MWAGRYQHYLESVLEGADEFHEVGDLMLRHATLAATNQGLKEQRNHFGEAAEQTRLESLHALMRCTLGASCLASHQTWVMFALRTLA